MPHTPGPWTAHNWGDAEVEIVGPNDRVICELAQEYDEHSGAGLNAAIDDDARLIAAAPELFEACQLLVALEDSDAHNADTRWKTARKMMRAAISKVKGNKPT